MKCPCGKDHGLDEMPEEQRVREMGVVANKALGEIREVILRHVEGLDTGRADVLVAVMLTVGSAVLVEQLQASAALSAASTLALAIEGIPRSAEAARAHPSFRALERDAIAQHLSAVFRAIGHDIGATVHVGRTEAPS